MLKVQDVRFMLHLCLYFVRKGTISHTAIIDFCKKRLEKEPYDSFARRVLAWIYAYGKKDYPNAVAEYKKLIGQGIESFELYKALGYAQQNMGDFCGALIAFAQAGQMKPDDSEVLAQLGYAYMRTEMYREALDVLERALAMGYPEGLLNRYRGFCLLMLGEHNIAAEEYDKALANARQDPKLAEEAAIAHTNFGIQLSDEEKWELATQEFRRAMEIDASYMEAFVGLSRVMFIKREFTSAIELANEIIRKKPSDYRGYLMVGHCLTEQGAISEAIEICERGKAQADDPEGCLRTFLPTLYRSLG